MQIAAAMPVIHRLSVGGMGCGRRVQLGTGAIAGIQKPLCAQLFKTGLIHRRAAALIAFRLIAAVKVQPQKGEIVQKLFCQRPAAAGGVEILNAQQHPSALFLRGKPGKQRAQHIAEVQPARRRRGKATDRFHRQNSCPWRGSKRRATAAFGSAPSYKML